MSEDNKADIESLEKDSTWRLKSWPAGIKNPISHLG